MSEDKKERSPSFSFLALILKEVEDVDPTSCAGPENQMDPEKETLLGVANNEQIRLWHLRAYYRSKHEELVKQLLEETEVDEVRDKLIPAASRAHDIAALFDCLFWNSIEDDFDVRGKSVGIRKGFHVVAREKEEGCNCPACQIARRVAEGGADGGMIIAIGHLMPST